MIIDPRTNKAFNTNFEDQPTKQNSVFREKIERNNIIENSSKPEELKELCKWYEKELEMIEASVAADTLLSEESYNILVKVRNILFVKLQEDMTVEQHQTFLKNIFEGLENYFKAKN